MLKVETKSHANNKIVEELAQDYASYIKVDLPSQAKKVNETVEEMMVRLEEFESIVGMVKNLRAECTYEHLLRFQSVQPQLDELCKRIDALEHVVARASIDLNNLESAVDTAEIELGSHTTVSDRLRGIFNPLLLFKNKSSEAPGSPAGDSGISSTRRELQNFELPPIFRAQDYFKSGE